MASSSRPKRVPLYADGMELPVPDDLDPEATVELHSLCRFCTGIADLHRALVCGDSIAKDGLKGWQIHGGEERLQVPHVATCLELIQSVESGCHLCDLMMDALWWQAGYNSVPGHYGEKPAQMPSIEQIDEIRSCQFTCGMRKIDPTYPSFSKCLPFLACKAVSGDNIVVEAFVARARGEMLCMLPNLQQCFRADFASDRFYSSSRN